MKNKLNTNNLINTYYYNGIYELEFYEEGKFIFIRNIKEENHPHALSDEWYFDNEDVLKVIIKYTDDKDIDIYEN